MARAWATIEVARRTAGSWNPAQRSASGGRSRRLTSAVVRPRRSSSSRAVSSAAAQREGVAGLPAIVTTSIMAPPERTVTIPRFPIALSTKLVDIGDISSRGSGRQEGCEPVLRWSDKAGGFHAQRADRGAHDKDPAGTGSLSGQRGWGKK